MAERKKRSDRNYFRAVASPDRINCENKTGTPNIKIFFPLTKICRTNGQDLCRYTLEQAKSSRYCRSPAKNRDLGNYGSTLLHRIILIILNVIVYFGAGLVIYCQLKYVCFRRMDFFIFRANFAASLVKNDLKYTVRVYLYRTKHRFISVADQTHCVSTRSFLFIICLG